MKVTIKGTVYVNGIFDPNEPHTIEASRVDWRNGGVLVQKAGEKEKVYYPLWRVLSIQGLS